MSNKFTKIRAAQIAFELGQLSRNGYGTLKEKQRFRHSMENFQRILKPENPQDEKFLKIIQSQLRYITVPLDSQGGFKNMGLPLLESMSFRSAVLKYISQHHDLSYEQLITMKLFLSRSYAMGMYPELWKFARILTKYARGTFSRRLIYWRMWCKYLARCEYSLLKKTILLGEAYLFRLRLAFARYTNQEL